MKRKPQFNRNKLLKKIRAGKIRFETPIASVTCECGITHFIYPNMIRRKLTNKKGLFRAITDLIKKEREDERSKP